MLHRTKYFILKTTYSIPNPEKANSEVLSLMNSLNSVKNACPLINYSLVKDEVMCFKNHIIKLFFDFYD